MHASLTPPEQSDAAQPRLPVRANGRRRYELLLDAAERLLEQGEGQPLTIQRLAREAGVPMASVYHFLPSPAAVSVALSQRYMAGFGELVMRPVPNRERLGWREVIATLNQRAVTFYREHPYAQKLILGSDHSWAIRRSDLANNRRIAGAVVELVADKFPDVPADVLFEAVVVGISIGDAVFTLSIAEHGEITPALGQEAALAMCGYLAIKFETTPTD